MGTAQPPGGGYMASTCCGAPAIGCEYIASKTYNLVRRLLDGRSHTRRTVKLSGSWLRKQSGYDNADDRDSVYTDDDADADDERIMTSDD